MKKTYWWRIMNMLVGISIFIWGYLAVNSFKLGLCSKGKFCLFSYNDFIDPLMFFSLFFLAASIFLFFVNDKIFLKWLKLAVVWIILSIMVIAVTPAFCGGWMPLYCFEREQVSILMGSLLVVLSIIQIIRQLIKEKKLKK